MTQEIDFEGSNLQVCIRDAHKGDRWDRLFMHIRHAQRKSPDSKFWNDALSMANTKEARFNRKPK